MQITEKQEAFLNGLVCQRLTDDPSNLHLIRSFTSVQGQPLSSYLHNQGWEDDNEGNMAVYLIKNQLGQVLLFFTLKCGSLFNPLDEAEIRTRHDMNRKLLDAVRSDSGTSSRFVQNVLERLRARTEFTPLQLKQCLKENVRSTADVLRDLRKDMEDEPNQKIQRVNKTHPGVELVHFCANDCARNFWKTSGIHRPMGEVLFWRFIAPLIFDIQRIIGCQYVYLFAADTSEDRVLVNYYEVALKFSQPRDIGTSKPRYDFLCEFMCQQIRDLRRNHRDYFAHFNPDLDDEFI